MSCWLAADWRLAWLAGWHWQTITTITSPLHCPSPKLRNEPDTHATRVHSHSTHRRTLNATRALGLRSVGRVLGRGSDWRLQMDDASQISSLQINSLLQPNPATKTEADLGAVSFADRFLQQDWSRRHVPHEAYASDMTHVWAVVKSRILVTVSPFYSGGRLREGIERALKSRLFVFEPALGGAMTWFTEFEIDSSQRSVAVCAPEVHP